MEKGRTRDKLNRLREKIFSDNGVFFFMLATIARRVVKRSRNAK